MTRLTVELFRPVPLGRLRVHAHTVRPGRRVQWIDIAMRDGDGNDVAGVHVLRVERTDVPCHDVGTHAQPTGVTMPRPPDEVDQAPLASPECSASGV